MTDRDSRQWRDPYDNMTEAERDKERKDLDEWRRRSVASPSWFFPIAEGYADD